MKDDLLTSRQSQLNQQNINNKNIKSQQNLKVIVSSRSFSYAPVKYLLTALQVKFLFVKCLFTTNTV